MAAHLRRPFSAKTPPIMSTPKEIPLMEKIVSLCKRRGFIFRVPKSMGELAASGTTVHSAPN
jgi:hypothetical protein